jgi:hypothetical protein
MVDEDPAIMQEFIEFYYTRNNNHHPNASSYDQGNSYFNANSRNLNQA